MALSGLVWNYSHTGWCGCDQAEERRTHGGLGGEGKHQTRQAQCYPQCPGGNAGTHSAKKDKLNAHPRLDLFVCRRLHITSRPKCSGSPDPVLQTAHV